MFAKHLHHPPRWSEEFIIRLSRSIPLTIGHREQCFEPIRKRLVRTEDAEILLLIIQRHDRTQEFPEHMRVTDAANPWLRYGNRIVAEIWQAQIAQQFTTIGVRVRAHASVTRRGEMR